MTNDQSAPLGFRARLQAGALFIGVAVPSLGLYFFSVVWLLLEGTTGVVTPVLALLGCAVAGLGMLAGTGRWRCWWHLAPLYAIPFVFFISLAVGVMLPIPLFLVVAAVVSIAVLVEAHRRIDAYYRHRHPREPDPPTGV